MRSLIQEGKVLVIDDFHYIEPEVQKYIARTLKTELFHGLKAVILTLPHRSDDAIRLNPDLIGRTTVIDIAPWSLDELKKSQKRICLVVFPHYAGCYRNLSQRKYRFSSTDAGKLP